MIKKNKWKIIFTSVIILLPVLAGLILWNKLPDTVPTHWGASGEVDGYSNKAFAVLGIPLVMLVIHWICIFVSMLDPKHRNVEGKPLGVVLWICPLMSLLCGFLILSAALGYDFSVEIIMPIIIGILFIVIGNYLPKCRHNYTIGIKLPWTLNDEENWNHTHRFAGPVWVIGGIMLMALSLVPSNVVFILLMVVVILMVSIPTIYSYVYYRRHNKS